MVSKKISLSSVAEIAFKRVMRSTLGAEIKIFEHSH